jgi:glycyl-tRNA synthetase beta chain
MDFILEIGTEELPAFSVKPALEYLEGALKGLFEKEGLAYGEIKTFGTPRRLAILVKDLSEEKPKRKVTVWGPPKNIAFDGEGKPTKALEGFLRKNNASLEDIKILPKGKGEYVALEKTVGGETAEEILQRELPEILDQIPFPKYMRWDSSGKRFLRPVRWILALTPKGVVKFRWGNLESSNHTYGHRFLSGGEGFRGKRLEVKNPEEYLHLLGENFVMADHRQRKEKIEEALARWCQRLNARVPLKEDLVEENTFLVEYVHPIVGSFDEKYLELPPLVIVTVAAHHQRFFCFQKPDGQLVNRFLAISNNVPKDENVVREGFEKVLRARLEDALFFYREDLKRPLESLVPKLQGVLQHPKLGTLYDKTRRLIKLGESIAQRLCPQKVEKVKRAAYLSKADLLTEMVKELDELQGYMGFVYAKAQGEDEEVAQALWEQYKPKGAHDELPQTQVGTVLAVADKLHDLVGYFGIGEKPKASADPLGLRRAALGIIRIAEGKNLTLDLKGLIEETYRLFEGLKLDKETLLRELEDFFKQRLENYLAPVYGRDLVKAVLAVKSGFTVGEIIQTVRELKEILDSPRLAEVREAHRRVKKILSKVKESYTVREELLGTPHERELYREVVNLEGEFKNLSPSQRVEKLARLKGVIDRFFDHVMVMAKEEELRKNRIALLQRVRKLFESVADFERLPLKGEN